MSIPEKTKTARPPMGQARPSSFNPLPEPELRFCGSGIPHSSGASCAEAGKGGFPARFTAGFRSLPVVIAALVLAPLASSYGAITVYVSGGDFSAPYYNFSLDNDFTMPFNIQVGGNHALDINQSYTFRRANDVTSHPFYISDQGLGNPSTTVTLTGDGSPGTGISGSQSFTLTFDTFDPATDTLTYWCTVHPSMVSTFNVIPEPSTAVLFGGAMAFLMTFRRRLTDRA